MEKLTARRVIRDLEKVMGNTESTVKMPKLPW